MQITIPSDVSQLNIYFNPSQTYLYNTSRANYNSFTINGGGVGTEMLVFQMD